MLLDIRKNRPVLVIHVERRVCVEFSVDKDIKLRQ